jgi:acetyl-CoA acetyltransferase
VSRQPVIVGVSDAPTHERGRALPGTHVLSMQRDCANEALAEAGLTMADVDGVAVAGMWGMPGPGAMQPILLTEYLGVRFPKYLDGTNVGGSAFVLHAGHAYEMIKAGVCDTVLILYGSMQKSQSARSLGGRPALFSNQWDMVAGLPSPAGAYAMAANRHMHQYGSSRETLAEIAVATRGWAGLNPAAAFRDPMTMDDVLNAAPIVDPLGRFDCCLVTDGGGAVVMTTEERAKDLKTRPVYVLGHGESASHSNINYMPDMAHLEVAEHSSKRAYAQAGRGPRDMDMAMIYDSFTITVLLTIEALGLCGLGEGKDFVRGQRTAPGGAFPMNTNGGGLSYCHPGMYGIFLLIEATRQLRGDAGERQVDGLTNAVCHGTGGVLSSGASVILSNTKD